MEIFLSTKFSSPWFVRMTILVGLQLVFLNHCTCQLFKHEYQLSETVKLRRLDEQNVTHPIHTHTHIYIYIFVSSWVALEVLPNQVANL